MLFSILSGLFLPPAGAVLSTLLYASGAILVHPAAIGYWRYACALGATAGVTRAIWLFQQKMQAYANAQLGYLGELLVGDGLSTLERVGFRVFHDLPAAGGNIDHVVVGRSGIFVIETKTRRKLRDEKDAHVIRFDGENLCWPRWGVCNRPLQQAEANAKWLRREIAARTSVATQPTPIVTIPGWFVEDSAGNSPEQQRRPARVVATPSLAKFIEAGPPRLGDEAVARIALLLDERCRTVAL